MLGEQRDDMSTRSRTGSGALATIPGRAASSPRSLSTAGCRPRTNSRSSARAATASSCALAMASRAGAARSGGRVGVGLARGLVRVGGAGAGHPQVHGQRDQPLLGAVVEVALDPAPFGVG